MPDTPTSRWNRIGGGGGLADPRRPFVGGRRVARPAGAPVPVGPACSGPPGASVDSHGRPFAPAAGTAANRLVPATFRGRPGRVVVPSADGRDSGLDRFGLVACRPPASRGRADLPRNALPGPD